MARVYTFRGMTIEELQKLSVEDFTKILTSRQRRAIVRLGISYKSLLSKVAMAKKTNKLVKTQVREAVILPSWVGMNFAIHNGKEYKQFEIRPEMLGHRLGEFAFSTKRVQHSAPGIRATRGSKFLAVK
ncbi:MAG: 30S ribosomal protein S19 [Candidatus Micrarchaeota archaeon]|nr:30S ribosomal protein S19 [Candidatus Micrarchaeota archaeon]MDE1847668.1 30S ribosomal protein S19 [Candidatus Micrarchaeota archaeon]MDE1864489.1 30S ribosomal protein S19 [Candidatus Micrarchaeota archaeon]